MSKQKTKKTSDFSPKGLAFEAVNKFAARVFIGSKTTWAAPWQCFVASLKQRIVY